MLDAAPRFTIWPNNGIVSFGDTLKDANIVADISESTAATVTLAEQTGGFLVRDTNDARASFRQIAQDMRFHYVLGYTPSNDNYDGRFRKIAALESDRDVAGGRRGASRCSARGSTPAPGRSRRP